MVVYNSLPKYLGRALKSIQTVSRWINWCTSTPVDIPGASLVPRPFHPGSMQNRVHAR